MMLKITIILAALFTIILIVATNKCDLEPIFIEIPEGQTFVELDPPMKVEKGQRIILFRGEMNSIVAHAGGKLQGCKMERAQIESTEP